MSESPQGGNARGQKPSDASSLETKERDAQLDAAIEATFPASEEALSALMSMPSGIARRFRREGG